MYRNKPDDHYYTHILGDEAVGKSTILAKMGCIIDVNQYTFENYGGYLAKLPKNPESLGYHQIEFWEGKVDSYPDEMRNAAIFVYDILNRESFLSLEN